MASLVQATHAVHRKHFSFSSHKMIVGVPSCTVCVCVRLPVNGELFVHTRIIMNYNNWQRVKIHWNCYFFSRCFLCVLFSFKLFIPSEKISVFIFVFQHCFNISLAKTHKENKIFHMNGFSFPLCKYLLLMNRQLNEPRKIEYIFFSSWGIPVARLNSQE